MMSWTFSLPEVLLSVWDAILTAVALLNRRAAF